MKHIRRIIAAATVVLGLASFSYSPMPVMAQDGVFDIGVLTNTLSMDHVTQMERKRASKMRGSKGSSLKSALTRSVRVTKTSKATPRALGTFTFSPAVRKRAVANFISTMRRIDPQNAPSLERDLASKDVLGVVAQKMASVGLKSNAVADAMAVYLVVAWKGARGSNDEGTRAQYLGVREQMAQAMAGVPALSSATNAKKQELADSLLLQALLVDSYVSGAKINPASISKVKAGVAQGARNTFGFDLTALRLTDHGLRL